MRDETLAIHAGYSTDPTTRSVATPIDQTVAYEFDSAQHGADLFNPAVPGNIYSRMMNPANGMLEEQVAVGARPEKIRIGVGIVDIDDILAGLDQALEKSA